LPPRKNNVFFETPSSSTAAGQGDTAVPMPYNQNKHPMTSKADSANQNVYEVHKQDAIALSKTLLSNGHGDFQLIYLDPPYNTKRLRGSR
jgi:hypothetical protein